MNRFLNRALTLTFAIVFVVIVAAIFGLVFSLFIGLVLSVALWQMIILEYFADMGLMTARMFAAVTLVAAFLGTLGNIGRLGSLLDELGDAIIADVKAWTNK